MATNPCAPIIPYQEIIGNYSYRVREKGKYTIIPYQEIIGNYSKSAQNEAMVNYTIPRNNRELQLLGCSVDELIDYTIPRNNRELQRCPGI